MAHLDPSTPIDVTLKIFTDHPLRLGVKTDALQARIVGGQKDVSGNMIFNLEKELMGRKVTIVEQDTLRFGQLQAVVSDNEGNSRPTGSANVMLDTQSGELNDYQESISTRSKNDIEFSRVKVLFNSTQKKPTEFYNSSLGLK